jgi:hypothetical protein
MKNQKQSEKTNSGTSAVTLEKLQERLNNSDLSEDELHSITGGGPVVSVPQHPDSK